jgi:hypothetical protein
MGKNEEPWVGLTLLPPTVSNIHAASRNIEFVLLL